MRGCRSNAKEYGERMVSSLPSVAVGQSRAASATTRFGALRPAPSLRCADYLASNELDLYDLVPPPELAMDQRSSLAPLEEGAALRVVPGIDIVRHIVVEDEPGAGEHAADDQVPPRIERVGDSAQQLLGLSRGEIGDVLRGRAG